MTADPDKIDELCFSYRMAKTAEDTRKRLMAGSAAFVRTYLSGWTPNRTKAERDAAAARALNYVKRVLIEHRPRDDHGKPTLALPEVLRATPKAEADETIDAPIVATIAGPWWEFMAQETAAREHAKALTATLPIAGFVERTPGFGLWSAAVLVAEANGFDRRDDSGNAIYTGVRKLYKRYGLAPDDSYERGERNVGRKIPRARRGRVIGILADPLLKAKTRHPYGAVYDECKARHLAAERTKLHAHNLARRAMVKAVIHDAFRAWHGLPPDFVGSAEPDGPCSPYEASPAEPTSDSAGVAAPPKRRKPRRNRPATPATDSVPSAEPLTGCPPGEPRPARGTL